MDSGTNNSISCAINHLFSFTPTFAKKKTPDMENDPEVTESLHRKAPHLIELPQGESGMIQI